MGWLLCAAVRCCALPYSAFAHLLGLTAERKDAHGAFVELFFFPLGH